MNHATTKAIYYMYNKDGQYVGNIVLNTDQVFQESYKVHNDLNKVSYTGLDGTIHNMYFKEKIIFDYNPLTYVKGL